MHTIYFITDIKAYKQNYEYVKKYPVPIQAKDEWTNEWTTRSMNDWVNKCLLMCIILGQRPVASFLHFPQFNLLIDGRKMIWLKFKQRLLLMLLTHTKLPRAHNHTALISSHRHGDVRLGLGGRDDGAKQALGHKGTTLCVIVCVWTCICAWPPAFSWS